MFADFCARLKLKNIREYEDTRLARAEQAAARKKEFAKQINAVKATLEFEKKKADERAGAPVQSEAWRMRAT